ncbi:MAG TPA: hypothetical protein VGL56_17645 [Fimbriimonadaceae bacterium]
METILRQRRKRLSRDLRDSTGVSHACLWPAVTAAPVNLLNAAGGCQATLDVSQPTLDDGTVIAPFDGVESSAYYLVQTTQAAKTRPVVR